jgi:hypothetical protein
MMAPLKEMVAPKNKKLGVINSHLVRWICIHHYDEMKITFGSETRSESTYSIVFFDHPGVRNLESVGKLGGDPGRPRVPGSGTIVIGKLKR